MTFAPSCSLDLVPDNDSSPADPKPRRFMRPAQTSSATRQAVMGLDNLERKFSFAGAGVALLFVLFYIPERLLKNTSIAVTAKKLASGKCPAGYAFVKSVCSKTNIYHPSYWILSFCFIVVMGLAVAAFAYFRKRAGVIVASFMMGLASGIVGSTGVVFLALGAWLSVRAFRLNKYGDATFRGSNIKARERAQERRANRGTKTRNPKTKGAKAASSGSVTRTPAPSKRYTPKKTNRR